jgi:hypothetical protein
MLPPCFPCRTVFQVQRQLWRVSHETDTVVLDEWTVLDALEDRDMAVVMLSGMTGIA